MMTITRKLLIALPFLLLLAAGVAHADANDDSFVQQMNNVGVTGAPVDLIRTAQTICQGLSSGSTPDTLTDALVSQMGFKPARAATFVASSATHYCSQYANLQFQAPH